MGGIIAKHGIGAKHGVVAKRGGIVAERGIAAKHGVVAKCGVVVERGIISIVAGIHNRVTTKQCFMGVRLTDPTLASSPVTPLGLEGSHNNDIL